MEGPFQTNDLAVLEGTTELGRSVTVAVIAAVDLADISIVAVVVGGVGRRASWAGEVAILILVGPDRRARPFGGGSVPAVMGGATAATAASHRTVHWSRREEPAGGAGGRWGAEDRCGWRV